MISKFLLYEPTLDEWLVLIGGVFVIFLVAFLVTKFTKYGGGSNYGMTGEFDDDYHDYDDDI
ncbi:hypothetical protein Q4Q35_10420 [Flavivirga aquimarina]|uniref:Cbb3-type cytochrome oxidase assembly protein CcoS n=1 Tax=Flavivirga aquimarina TaxID=2027862 RepID=A0ABT8WAP1_9FLAO|nr:hypothetical protein [Flavivirga aquimarina]MDO5970221.1 hypothetical protein [Flavivirga aquimarina]